MNEVQLYICYAYVGEKARRQGQCASVVVYVIVFVFVIAFAFVFVIVVLLDRSSAFSSCPFNGLRLCGREGKEAKGKVRALLSPRWQLLHSLGFVSVMWTNKYVTQCIVSSYVDKLLHGHIVSGLADKCYPPRILSVLWTNK